MGTRVARLNEMLERLSIFRIISLISAFLTSLSLEKYSLTKIVRTGRTGRDPLSVVQKDEG
jgi:hypothetical protein